MKPFRTVAALAISVATMSANAAEPATPDRGHTPGRQVYQFACGKCHDSGLNGAPKVSDRAAWIARTPEWAAVLESHAVNGWVDMPPKGGYRYLAADDVVAAVGYIRGRLGSAAAATLSTQDAEGRRTYAVYCAGCHDQGIAGAPKIGDPGDWKGLSTGAMPIIKSHAVNGYFRMAPKGGYPSLSDRDVESAVSFMVRRSR
jgi:cytochrome c5